MTAPGDGESRYITDYEEERYEHAREKHGDMAEVPIVGDPLAQALSRIQANADAAKYAQEQTKALSQGQELREAPGGLGNTHYLSYEHKKLHAFVHENFEPRAVHEVGRLYHEHGSKMIAKADAIRRAAMKTEETWKGEAGNQMRAHVTRVADHMGHSGQAAQLTANQIGMQAEAGSRARNSMPEVIEFDLKDEMAKFFSDPNPLTAVSRANEIVEKHEKSQAAHQEAAQVMSTMEGSFKQAAGHTPAFVPVPPEPGDPGESRPGRQDPIQPFEDKPAETDSSWSEKSPSPMPKGPVLTPPPGPSPGPTPIPYPNPTPYPNPGPFPPRRGPTPGPGPRTPGPDTRKPPQRGPGPGTTPSRSSGSAGAGGTGAGRAGAGGAGAGGAARGGTGGGRIAGAGAGGTLGAGGRAGTGTPGGTAGAGSGSGGASAARGGSAVGGAAGAGARGGQGSSEEDQEHENKYMLDTDEAWGDLDLPKVAPPVLGDWGNENK